MNRAAERILATLRRAPGLTKEEIAERAYVSVSTLSGGGYLKALRCEGLVFISGWQRNGSGGFTTPLYSLTLRSTLSQNVVNELRFGITAKGGQSNFGFTSDIDSRNGPATFQDQGGFAIDLDPDGNAGLTNWWTNNGPSWRSAPTYSVANTVNWQRGSHSWQFGAEWLRATAQENAQQMVPGIGIGFSTQFDPAAGLFTGANFSGASSGDLTEARELYALLTGRVTSITGQAALDPATNKYVAFGPRTRAGQVDVFSGFV